MVHDRRSALSSYVNGLLSKGKTVFTAEEAEQALGVGHGAFLDASERLQRRETFTEPAAGFLCHRSPAIFILGGAAAGVVHRCAHAP